MSTTGSCILAGVLLFAATIACDVVGQLCFKIGASRLPAHDGPDTAGFLRGLFSDVWLLAGIAAYIGQLILWVLILALFGAAVATYGTNLPRELQANVLAVQGSIAAAFLLFIITTSNPFTRLDPAPLDGQGCHQPLPGFTHADVRPWDRELGDGYPGSMWR